jgi:DNA-directed RNA polymerase specialized sigma24 family protein
MKAATRKPERWNLTPEAFSALLQALGPDEAAAADRYEALRRRLVRYFGWERCTFPEDRADEVLNRFARRLGEGEPVTNPENYCHGIARLVVREAHLEMVRQQAAARELRVMPQPDPPEEDAADQCLARCLANLDEEHQTMLLAYYEGEKSHRIRNRQVIAARLGVSLNTLRNRALRLREKMETCTRDCMAAGGSRDASTGEHTDE